MGGLLLLLLLLLKTLRKPITITVTFPFLLHLLLLLNKKNTTQTDYKVIFNVFYYFHGITHYHRHIITSQVKIGFDPQKTATFCFYAISSSTRSTE